MISQRTRGLFSLFTAFQILLCFVSYWVYLAFSHAYIRPVVISWKYALYAVLFAIGLGLEAAFRHDGASDWYQKNSWRKHMLAVRQCLFAATPVVFYLTADKDQIIARSFFFSYLLVLYALLSLSNLYAPKFLAALIFKRKHLERTLIVGSIPKTARLMAWLEEKADLGIETIGTLSDDPSARYSSLPVLGGSADLERVVRDREVSQVIVAEFPQSAEYLTQLTAKCESLGVRLLVRSDLEERFRHPIVYMENDGIRFFALREEPLENPYNRVIKRTLDIVVSLPVVMFILPAACAIVWAFQKYQSPGPLFYRQKRSGFQRGEFGIIKFRTMHVNNPNVSKQATRTDPRIYSAGRIFRKFSVDELPQFINVLKGEMSVVGPRPHLPEHDKEFAKVLQNYFIRSAVKPGITGLAQIQGFRGEATDPHLIRGRIQCDIYYLENWSVLMDIWIIGRTIIQAVRPPSTAY